MADHASSEGSSQTKPEASHSPSPSPAHPKPSGAKKFIKLAVLAVVALVVVCWVIPTIVESFSTVSTDDAYVNSHVTFVAPRVAGQVSKVLVDDNNRVRKGELIVEIDPAPYEKVVAIKQAAVDAAKADLVATEASVRGLVAQTRGQRFKLQHAIETVDNQVALLRAHVAALAKSTATLSLAKTEFDRYSKLLETKVASREEYDQRQQNLEVAQAEVAQATENVAQDRVALGLPAKPESGKDLAQVPADIDQNFSAVRQALAELLQSAAQLAIVPTSYNLGPKEVIAEFYKRDPSGNLDKIYDKIIEDAPAQKQAKAKLASAQSELDQAQLDLSYCKVYAEIDGVVTRRNVNPGNNVQVGQSLMAIRSLTEIWIDANFKETQLGSLRIGQPVDLRLDMYGKHTTFKGRISGFTMGTGSTLSLLPAENATGNFIKVVQRLPVRIEVMDYDPEKQPLFVGLSVEPVVHINEEPTGPDAGKFLQPYQAAAKAAAPSTPAPSTSETPKQ